MYAVYALLDPDEIYKVCYIGISQDVYNRFTQHLRDVDSHSLKAQWLKGLRDRNRVPYCKVLEDNLSQEDAREREAYWIHFYKQLNMPLTNADIPQVPQNMSFSRPPDYQQTILDLYDQGMSGRAIEKLLKEKKVSYRQIAKTLDYHRRNTGAKNETDVQKMKQ